jgi:uncharacterized membrane protein
MAATVFALRYSGFAIMRHVRITPKVELVLEKMSVSVLVAIVASSVFAGGSRTAAAVTIGVVAMLITRNPIVAMLVGIAVGAVWSGLLNGI